MPPLSLSTVVLVLLLALPVGALLNALADDLPHYRWPRAPRYPDGAPRPASAWLGLGAFLLGQRRSPTGGAPLGWRYPLTELGLVALWAVTLWRAPTIQGMTWVQLGFYLFYTAALVLITVIDLEHKLILFSVTIPTTLVALIDASLPSASALPYIVEALLGAAMGYGVFYLFYLGGVAFSVVNRQMLQRNVTEVAFGYGDVMLAMTAGAILGWRALIFAMFITVFAGAFGAIAYLVGQRLAGRGASMTAALPYGPYIVIGTLLMLLFGSVVRTLLTGWVYG